MQRRKEPVRRYSSVQQRKIEKDGKVHSLGREVAFYLEGDYTAEK